MPLGSVHRRKFKSNLALLALIIGFVTLIFVITMVKMAHAEEAERGLDGCPAPISGDLPTDAVTTNCDMYARQIEYGAESQKFHENLKKRQEDYAKPRAESLKKYSKSLEERDQKIAEDQAKIEAQESEQGNSINEPRTEMAKP